MDNFEFKPQDYADIQGLVFTGYSSLSAACYLMLQFGDVANAKKWLLEIHGQITTYVPRSAGILQKKQSALQLAFTNVGMSQLVPENLLKESFSREFSEGMDIPTRANILGDLDENSNRNWNWGGHENETIHAILMVFEENTELLATQLASLEADFEQYGIKNIITLSTRKTPENREHFGFKDGLSQPIIKGMEQVSTRQKPVVYGEPNEIQPGEFILGYLNEYDKLPFSPQLNDGFDLGKNGSYMVVRQIEQDVRGFWGFMEKTAQTNAHFEGKDAVYVAAKMMGRWPNGNPLTLVPETNQETRVADRNDFVYTKDDADGLKCPVGAHIRKTNPRDVLDADNGKTQVSKRHRILRRGRTYGEPLHESMEPAEMLKSSREGTRGLFFVCFNANIGRQFEFIQQAWANSPKFDNLCNDVDPIIGFQQHKGKYVAGDFTAQDCPVRKKIHEVPQFTFIKGGAYFFMPGLVALKKIAEL